MKLKKQINWNYQALAFAFPFVGMLVIMMIGGCAPFGDRSLLYSDAYHQYYPFFKAFREALLSGDSLLYSWDVGMGMDYLGLISYYLASPLNLLSVLVPEEWLLGYFSLLTPVRMGLAGWFFAIFLNRLFDRDDVSLTLFGTFYATCAWVLGYRWNVMWVDTFALLPLVVLGTVSLLRDKKFILYTLSLFLAVFSNYYVGFFVCIFVALVFFCYELCRWQGVKRFICDLVRIAWFSALAIGMTAILELPAFAALQTTQSSVNAFPKEFRLNIADEHTWAGLLDAMRQVAGQMAGGYEPTWKEGLPNLHSGVITVFLGFLFLSAKEVKLRDKFCTVGLLLLFNVSFIIRQLDYIWHGFHFTNMIPYRFSFLYSFVMLYAAYRAWLMKDQFQIWQILLGSVLCAGIILCSDLREDAVYLSYNLGFLVLYAAVLIYGCCGKPLPEGSDKRQTARYQYEQKVRRGNVLLFLCAVMTVELIMNLVNFGVYLSTQSIAYYPRGTTYSASMIRYMKEREEDTLFYRAEVTHSQTLNDGALNSYDGISTFTSSANVKATEFMRVLGYGARNTYNRYCYEEASPVSDLFLGIKYMIERQGRDRGSAVYTDLYSYGDVHLLQNNAYLPLGYLAESELGELDFFAGYTSSFTFQNRLFAAATGVEGDVWRRLPGTCLSIEGRNVIIDDQSNTGYCRYSKALQDGSVVYTYTADQDGFMCVYLDLPKRNDVTILLNGNVVYTETTSLPQMMAVGDVAVGDIIEVQMACDEGEAGAMTLTAAIMNMERFWAGYEVLNASTLELTRFSNTRVEGTIQCDRDGLLYTSIPQNGNWSALVDGEESEVILVGDCMVAVELTQGSHEVAFVYRNPAFELGWKVSLACFAVFILLAWKQKGMKPKSRHGKYQK